MKRESRGARLPFHDLDATRLRSAFEATVSRRTRPCPLPDKHLRVFASRQGRASRPLAALSYRALAAMPCRFNAKAMLASDLDLDLVHRHRQVRGLFAARLDHQRLFVARGLAHLDAVELAAHEAEHLRRLRAQARLRFQ